MIHFGKCIKYQYRDTILNQVSVSISRYNLEVSYPTLIVGYGCSARGRRKMIYSYTASR